MFAVWSVPTGFPASRFAAFLKRVCGCWTSARRLRTRWGSRVDLFFALSSYLITELLIREHRPTGTLNIRAFYARRVLRIWPLYFFALFLAAPSLPREYLAGFALLSGNWMCALAGFPASPFALLWSVSIEEQFYLAWPWVVRARTQRIATVRGSCLPSLRSRASRWRLAAHCIRESGAIRSRGWTRSQAAPCSPSIDPRARMVLGSGSSHSVRRWRVWPARWLGLAADLPASGRSGDRYPAWLAGYGLEQSLVRLFRKDQLRAVRFPRRRNRDRRAHRRATGDDRNRGAFVPLPGIAVPANEGALQRNNSRQDTAVRAITKNSNNFCGMTRTTHRPVSAPARTMGIIIAS